MRSIALAALLVLTPLAACAPLQAALADPAAISTDVSKSPAGAYKLDGSHTALVWRVGHLGVSMYTARFDKVQGALTLDPANPSRSSVTIEVDVNSVSTGLRNAEGQLAFDKKVAEAMGGVTNPTARFVSTTVTRTGPTSGTITGNLTFNGVTKPVTLLATFGGGRIHPFNQKPMLGFAATGSIKRSDFGVTSWAGAVGDDVQLQIETEFVKE
jgi:polyisoprenoid-binding protein YceI